jgi:hypothetical protein
MRRAVPFRFAALAAVAVALAVLAAGCGGSSSSGSGSTTSTTSSTTPAAAPVQTPAGGATMTLYSKIQKQQFLNHQDDRQRGHGVNPFGIYGDATATTRQIGDGPFAGDELYVQFALFKDSKLTHRTGSAVMSCRYSFDKTALCDTLYTVSGSSLTGTGEFSDTGTTFTFAITAGTAGFRGKSGAVDVTTHPGSPVEKLLFTLR